MKTQGMRHQLEALRRMAGREYYALFMEQGTGKTWTLLADAERLYGAGTIDGVLVLAPNGVHTNWVLREIPEHMSPPYLARAWRSGAGKSYMAHIEELFTPRHDCEPPPLRILAMNIDAINTPNGFRFAARFLRATRALIVMDESSRIKNPDAARTERAIQLRSMAVCARISTGTPIANRPIDAFAQMEFLRSGLLGTTSYRAFVAEYAELMDSRHPMMARLIQRNPKAAFAQVVARDENGQPRWRNLDKLQQLLAPHSYRVLKKECLDLPEKIFKQRYFELTPALHRAYDLLERELRIELDDGTLSPVKALAALVKLQQITSGFVHPPGGGAPLYAPDGSNPRLELLVDMQQDIPGKFIVWARFREELRAIAAALRKAGRTVVEYHGDVPEKQRSAAIDAFQAGAADAFVGQPQAGGIGITLTAAEHVIYYSNDFNLETRLQSEDRPHRIGQRRNVVYTDLIATNTIDEPIARALQRKADVAAMILGDRRLRVPRAAISENSPGASPPLNAT